MTYRDLHNRVNDHPFKPFRMNLVNNTVYEITEPWMVMIGRSSAIVTTRTSRDAQGIRVADEWKTVSIHHMLEFSDIEPSRNGGKKRRR